MKKYLTGVVAVVAAFCLTSFTVPGNAAPSKATFYYWRSGTANEYSASSYTAVSAATYSGINCPSGSQVCKFSSSATMPSAGLLDTNGDGLPDALNNTQQTPITPLLKAN